MKKLLPFAILVLLLIIASIYFFRKDTGTTSRKDQTDFAIADTANVGKIFIADNKGRTITLKRGEGDVWIANDTYVARPASVKLLLETFRNVYIQRPVPKEAQEQINRVMAGGAKKVEIYNRDGKWIKTWYVGHGTMDKKGTYMLLETPEYGRASAPYVLDMKGFLGMLDTRFFTDLEEWRSVRILDYPDMALKEIRVEYPTDTEANFRIEYGGGNDIRLFRGLGDDAVTRFDTSMVKDYMLNYKLASFENFNTMLTRQQEDSIMAEIPFQVIRVTDAKGSKTIRLWRKSPEEGQFEMDGETPAVVDLERVYAAIDDGILATAQRLTWDNFRAPVQAFLLPEAP